MLYSTLRKITITYKTCRNLLYLNGYIWVIRNVFNGGVVVTFGTNYPLKFILFWPQWLVAFVTKFYKEFHSLFVLMTSCSVLVLSDTVHHFEFSRIGLLRDSNADRCSILIRRDGQFWLWLFPNDEQSTLSSEIIHKCFKFLKFPRCECEFRDWGC